MSCKVHAIRAGEATDSCCRLRLDICFEPLNLSAVILAEIAAAVGVEVAVVLTMAVLVLPLRLAVLLVLSLAVIVTVTVTHAGRLLRQPQKQY